MSENPDLEKPFGIDVSRYQGQIDWDVVSNHTPKVLFSGIRATINHGYTDTWFSRNWREAKKVGIARTAYHIVFPGTSADLQMNHFLKVVGDDYGELPLTLDLELDHGVAYNRISERILQCSTLIENRTGKKPLMYSRTNWVNQYITGHGPPPGWLDEHDWWLALYKRTGEEHQGPVPLPKGVSPRHFLIHQTTDRGTPFGVATKQLDYDRWQGNLDSFLSYLGKKNLPEAALTLEERISRLEEIARAKGWNL